MSEDRIDPLTWCAIISVMWFVLFVPINILAMLQHTKCIIEACGKDPIENEMYVEERHLQESK